MKSFATKRKRSPRNMKRIRKMDINSLPIDLLIEVLLRVASCSFTDFFHAKLTCKSFLKAANEDCMYEKISLDKLPLFPRFETEEMLKFLQQCKEKENPEALYRQGMIDYFSHKKPESGIAFLKRAVEKCHVDAIYVYGMILLRSGGRDEEQGMKMLQHMKNSNSNQIKFSRKRTRKVLGNMWVNIEGGKDVFRGFEYQRKAAPCDCYKYKGFEMANEDYEECCEPCFWEREIRWFSHMV